MTGQLFGAPCLLELTQSILSQIGSIEMSVRWQGGRIDQAQRRVNVKKWEKMFPNRQEHIKKK